MLAILSKSSTVMLPVVLGLCWWWKDGGGAGAIALVAGAIFHGIGGRERVDDLGTEVRESCAGRRVVANLAAAGRDRRQGCLVLPLEARRGRIR